MDTLNLLATLLSQVTISPNFDGFEAQALAIAKARRELLAAIEEKPVQGEPDGEIAGPAIDNLAVGHDT